MREKNRIPIASHRKLPQFTTMNVIDGQAGLVIYSSLIFYSLTIDNILNIIVLLIIAGVTITTLTGDNGLLQKVTTAKQANENASIEEQIKLVYSEWQIAHNSKEITEDATTFMQSKLRTNLKDDGIIVRENLGMYVVTLSNKKRYRLEINVQEIAKDNTQSFVGYYTDVDEDGEIDGIIFVDLLAGSKKTKQAWNSTTYTLPTDVKTSNVKEYYISKKDYEEAYGVKDVISPKSEGKDRFYVMSLTDFSSDEYINEGDETKNYPAYTQYRWYRYAYNNLNPEDTSIEFGTGKRNTETMIKKWNNKICGNQDNQDIWKHIQDNVNDGWFVPSKEEWAAYANELGPGATYGSLAYGMQNYYWSSSIIYSNCAWTASFAYGYPAYKGVSDIYHFRLATTF